MSDRSEMLRVATYNVHGCVGRDGQRSEERSAEVIRELEVDIVGLQELDRGRRRSGGIDQAEAIASRLGWHWHFQAATENGDEHYGHAILSRFPLQVRRTLSLPGRPPFYCRESRAAAGVDVATNFGTVQVVNTHLGLGRRERLEQAELLVSTHWGEGAETGRPLILLGDLNCLPGSKPHRLLGQHLRDVRTLVHPSQSLRTFPTAFPLLAVDHIFVNTALQPVSLRVHRSARARVASDHFPLVAEMLLGQGEK